VVWNTLLHDIHERTAEALPILLGRLKSAGFHVVHVVPAASKSTEDLHGSGAMDLARRREYGRSVFGKK
jgi:hypothetical protein